MVLSQHPMFAQFGNWGGVGSGNSTATNSIFNLNSSNENFRNANFNLRINLGNRFNFGNFDFSNLNANDCCVEQPLADIYFGYNIEAALAASALIQQAGDRALNQWFHRQHTVLKKEIEKQLWQSFSNYDDARNTYFKYHENIAVSHNHKPIKSKYNARRLDGENKRSISLKNLKLLRLRENEIILSNSVNGVPVVPKEQINVDYVINNGTINLHAKKSITMSPGFHAKPGTLFHATTGNVNSSYGNFTYNGTSLDQIQNLSELQSMWENELSTFTDIHLKHHNDYYTYLKIRSIGHITNYNDPLFVDLFNKQLANYNRYDEWKQLDLMQAYLNEIRPPLALPSGYISPKFYATSQYLENYAVKNKGGGRSVFDPYYDMYGPFYQIWLAREDRQEARSQVNRYKQYRNNELNKLLNEVSLVTDFPLIKYPENSNYETLYPKLTNVLKNDLPKIAQNQKVIDVINGITGAPKEVIEEALLWGKGPTIRIQQLGGEGDAEKYGSYRGHLSDDYLDTLFLDIDLVNEFENSNITEVSDALSFLIAVTILHEYVHLGDMVFGDNFWGDLFFNEDYDPENEAGIIFETDIFGEAVWRENAGIILRKIGGF